MEALLDGADCYEGAERSNDCVECGDTAVPGQADEPRYQEGSSATEERSRNIVAEPIGGVTHPGGKHFDDQDMNHRRVTGIDNRQNTGTENGARNVVGIDQHVTR